MRSFAAGTGHPVWGWPAPGRGILFNLVRGSSGASAERQGGDRVSQRIETHAALILVLLEQKSDQTLFELCDKLAEDGVQTNLTPPRPG